jgi:hypothetical protein
LTQEIEDLRRAQTKSLEMLLSYQEENDLLRSTVAKMATEKSASAANNSASSAEPGADS